MQRLVAAAVLLAAFVLAAPRLVRATDAALGAWLPTLGGTFTPWGVDVATYTGKADMFVCASSTPDPRVTKPRFEYAVAACPLLQHGTSFEFGSGEPKRGKVVYDPTHRIALFSVGCCALRSYALASGVAAPPQPVRRADLSAVHTLRGVRLGMTASQVEAVYGRATARATLGPAVNVRVLTYSSYAAKSAAMGSGCGQFQSFAFRSNRLYHIEIDAGC